MRADRHCRSEKIYENLVCGEAASADMYQLSIIKATIYGLNKANIDMIKTLVSGG